MMTAGFEAKNLVVKYVREPGDRVPIAGMGSHKGPRHFRGGKSMLNMRVVINVEIIIHIDEAMISQRPVANEGHDC